MTSTLPTPTFVPSFARLDALSQLALSGEDAANFLHNQITNDVLSLTPELARLAAYCSPKGRMLASFLLWRSEESIFLQTRQDVLPMIQKRLQMFVLRAKVKLSVREDLLTYGLVGADAVRAFAPLPVEVYDVVQGDFGVLIRLTDVESQPRYQWIANAEQQQAMLPIFAANGIAEVAAASFHLTDIVAGIPQIVAATQDQFVPQMINFELIGGVNFKKGCYPGQEIVARSQYLGKLKRRMLPASVAAPATAGMELFASDDPDQPCGMVVNAERDQVGNTALLAEIKIAVLDHATVRLGAADGPELQFAALPYALPDTP